MQNLPGVVGVVTYAEPLLYQGGHTLRGPQADLVTVAFRSSKQHVPEPVELPPAHPRRPPLVPRRVQGVQCFASLHIRPVLALDRDQAGADSPRYLRLRLVLDDHQHRLLPPLLQHPRVSMLLVPS